MSMLNRTANATDVGETLASVRDYETAQKTVSQLIAAEVPARDIAIVGLGVRTIERVTGRLGYAAAARSGAINGVLIGLFLSAILVLGNPEAPIQLFVGFVFIGVALGMILSLVTYSIVRRRRDYASVMQLAADHYEVTVMPASLAKARQALGRERSAPPARPVDLDEPPRYGERVSPGAPRPETPAPPAVPPRPAAPAPQYGERVDTDAGATSDAGNQTGPVPEGEEAAPSEPDAPVDPATPTDPDAPEKPAENA